MPTFLLVTVTKAEAQAVRSAMSAAEKPWERRHINGKTYYDLGEIAGAQVYMVQSEMETVTPGGALLTVRRALSADYSLSTNEYISERLFYRFILPLAIYYAICLDYQPHAGREYRRIHEMQVMVDYIKSDHRADTLLKTIFGSSILLSGDELR